MVAKSTYVLYNNGQFARNSGAFYVPFGNVLFSKQSVLLISASTEVHKNFQRPKMITVLMNLTVKPQDQKNVDESSSVTPEIILSFKVDKYKYFIHSAYILWIPLLCRHLPGQI